MKIFNFRQEKPACYPLALTLSFVYKNNDNAIFEASIIIKISIISSPITEWWQTMQMYRILLYVRRDSRAAISIGPKYHLVIQWRNGWSCKGIDIHTTGSGYLTACTYVLREARIFISLYLWIFDPPPAASLAVARADDLCLCASWFLFDTICYAALGWQNSTFLKEIQSERRRCACLQFDCSQITNYHHHHHRQHHCCCRLLFAGQLSVRAEVSASVDGWTKPLFSM